MPDRCLDNFHAMSGDLKLAKPQREGIKQYLIAKLKKSKYAIFIRDYLLPLIFMQSSDILDAWIDSDSTNSANLAHMLISNTAVTWQMKYSSTWVKVQMS